MDEFVIADDDMKIVRTLLAAAEASQNSLNVFQKQAVEDSAALRKFLTRLGADFSINIDEFDLMLGQKKLVRKTTVKPPEPAPIPTVPQ